MKCKKILVFGNFVYDTDFNKLLGGQSIKTRNIFELLKINENENNQIIYFDTHVLRKNKLSIFTFIKSLLSSNVLVYLPGQKNLKYLFPILYYICSFKKIRILYIVVGGWLNEFLEKNKFHNLLLKKISGIFTESSNLKCELHKKQGLENVFVLPNFRIHSFIPQIKKVRTNFKIVFFARISIEKGIDVVFRLAENIQNKTNTLSDIEISFYGSIDPLDNSYFNEKIKIHKNVSYGGIINPKNAYETISQYDILILPTRYPGEGFPGTIIDSYISGIPVVVSNWKYLPEFVEHGKTGFIFNLDNEQSLYDYVYEIYNNRDLLYKMKIAALNKSKEYSAEHAWDILKEFII